MIDFEVISENSKFYTKGFEMVVGCEFEIVLDELTANRVGKGTAQKWFSLLAEKIEGLTIEDNLELSNLSLKKPNNNIEELRTVTSNKAVLKRVNDRGNVKVYRLVLSDPRGYWPWEEGCSPDWKCQW